MKTKIGTRPFKAKENRLEYFFVAVERTGRQENWVGKGVKQSIKVPHAENSLERRFHLDFCLRQQGAFW